MISGFAFHCHHDRLVEWVWDYAARKAYILTKKPKAERPLRLRVFKLLPLSLLPPDMARVWAELARTWAEVDRVWAEAERAGEDRAGVKSKAWAEAGRAIAEVDRAIQVNMPALEKLHQRLCPDCSWDGKTIFPRKVE